MSGTDNAAEAITDGARLLAFDLARVSGALEEIATTWRRAWPTRPELPLRLQDAARALAADARGLAAADSPQAPGGGLSVTSRLSALENGVATAQAMTRAPGMPPAGDAGLWEYLDTALRQAGTRLPDLTSA